LNLVADVREVGAALPGTVETFPFDARNLVLKVGGSDGQGGPPVLRMYAMVDVTEDPLRLLVKCDPAQSALLREAHPQIVPAAYFGGHWVFLPLDGSLPEGLAHDLLIGSYDLVLSRNVPRRIRERLPARSR